MMFEEDINNCLLSLKNGEVILYPTDTVWGLGCDATNPAAVEKIYKIKSRSTTKTLIILVYSQSMLERYVKEVPDITYELASVSDTPLTIIYPEGKNLANGVCAEDGSIAIRICHDEFCNELIRRFRKPIVSTSANSSGQPSPLTFTDIDKSVVGAVNYVVKYRQDDPGKNSASPIIKVQSDGTFKIIRK